MTTLLELLLPKEPFPEAQRRRFKERGFIIQEPQFIGSLLPAYEWHSDTFLAIKGKEAHISLLRAKQPGNGAWGRLFSRLKSHGYTVVVSAPLPRFEQHLKKLGFVGPFWVGKDYNDYHDEYRWPK